MVNLARVVQTDMFLDLSCATLCLVTNDYARHSLITGSSSRTQQALSSARQTRIAHPIAHSGTDNPCLSLPYSGDNMVTHLHD